MFVCLFLFLLDGNKDQDLNEEDEMKSDTTPPEANVTPDIAASRKNSVASLRNDSPMSNSSAEKSHVDDGVETLSRQSSIVSCSNSRREISSGISVQSSVNSNGNEQIYNTKKTVDTNF